MQVPPNMQLHLVTSDLPKNGTGPMAEPVLTVINFSTKTNPDGSIEAVMHQQGNGLGGMTMSIEGSPTITKVDRAALLKQDKNEEKKEPEKTEPAKEKKQTNNKVPNKAIDEFQKPKVPQPDPITEKSSTYQSNGDKQSDGGQPQCPSQSANATASEQSKIDNLPVLREPWNSQVNYNPQLGLGMRTKRHFFPEGDELVFLDGQFHTAESFQRRFHQHIFKDHYLLLQGNIDTKIHDRFSVNDPGRSEVRDSDNQKSGSVEAQVYIWHQYYEPQWDTGHVGSSKDRAVNLKRNETKAKDETDPVAKENAIVCLARDWEPSVEFPVDVFEEDEKQQIVELMLEKIALQHHERNFRYFVKIFGQEVVVAPDFAKYFFTVDPAESKGHAVTKDGGILFNIKATDIETLKPKQDGQQFFENQVSITPNKIVISQLQQLTVHKETFEIKNTASKANFTIYDVFASSPEILILDEAGLLFGATPIRLKPGESIKLTVVIIPETLELLEAAIFVAFNPRRVFMLPVSVYVTPNALGLKPIYYANVNTQETVKTKIEVYNPTDQNLIISEAYSTEDFVTLMWPNGRELNAQDTHTKDYTSYLTIPPKKSKTVFVASFYSNYLVDHHALIHLMFDSGHIMRIPMYFHVYYDIVKFLPSIVDFGVVPINFDLIRIPVTLKIRPGHNIKSMTLTEVMLPLNDVRLDFVMGDWDRDTRHHTKVFNKNTKRLEERRQGMIYADQEFFLMTVVMKPYKYGTINTQIRMNFETEFGAIHQLTLPIVGYVAPMHNMVIERKGNNFYQWLSKDVLSRNPFFGFLPPEPVSQVNVRKFIDQSTRVKNRREEDLNKRFSVKLDENHVEFPLNVYGNFQKIATGSLEVINLNPKIEFKYLLPRYSSVNSMERKQLGQFSLDIQDFECANTKKYFFIAASHTLFPQYIQFTDQRLICRLMDDDINNPEYTIQYCDDGIYFNYGEIGLYQSKNKVLNITNLGSETVTLDWVTKNYENDEMSVSYQTDYDNLKDLYPEIRPTDYDESEDTEFLNREISHVKTGIWILPGHTVSFTFSLEGVIGSLKGGQASDNLSRQIICNFVPILYRPFVVQYTYKVIPGGIALTENLVKFDPGFVGLEQTREVKMKSDFQVPVNVISISSSDPRIQPSIKKEIIDPGTIQSIIDISFNPGLSKQSSPSSATSSMKHEQNDALKSNQTTSWKLSDLNISNYTQVISEALKTVNEDDVALWRSYQSQNLMLPTWIEGNWIQGVIEDIHAVVTVKTNIVGSIQIPVSAQVTKPKIISDRFFDFGGTQVGSYKTKSLKVVNPFNETLYVNLFIGRNTVESVDEVQRLTNYQRHKGQVELLSQAKGTKYESQLRDEINTRLNITGKFNQYQQKIAQLPELALFCKNARLKNAEKQSPSMRSWPESESSQEMTLLDELNREKNTTQIESGKPFPIFLRNDNDIEMCDLLQTTMAMMPDHHFQTSMWKIINSYFSQRQSENIELESIINFQKVKEQERVLVDPTDEEGLKEHLMYKLQEQLRNMYPDSMKIADEIDREIAKDINKNSYQSSLMWDPVQNYQHLRNELAFPNYFQNSWVGTFTKLLQPSTLMSPVSGTVSWVRDMWNSKTWGETGSRVVQSFNNAVHDLLYRGLKPKGHNASTYVSSSFIDKQGRFKNVNPAPAISRQWELKSSRMHDEILQNNGTVGVEVYSQNFYINPAYQGKTYEIQAGESIFLEDAVIFEPRTFTSSQDQMQMSLYVKSDKAVLQTLPLKGWASSAVLDITQISKSVSFSNNVQDNSTSILASYSQNCMQRLMQLKSSEPDEFKSDGECLDAIKSLELVQNQTLGKSTIPQLVNLYVHESDILNTNVESFEKNFLSRMFSPFETLASLQNDIDANKETQINQNILWELSVMNVGEIDFSIISIYLEDPLTGERSCYQDGLRLWPCIDQHISALKTRVFNLQYTSDFGVSELRKTLVFESLDQIQRFPIQIDISAKALRVASDYISDTKELSRPVFGTISQDLFKALYAIMFGTALGITFSLIQMYNSEDQLQKEINQANCSVQSFVNKGQQQKGQKALDSVQKVLSQVTPSYVLNQYSQTQERFRQHSSIFLRECVNLSQRKNSITIEYQRNQVIRLSKQQTVYMQSKKQNQGFKPSPSQNSLVEEQPALSVDTGDSHIEILPQNIVQSGSDTDNVAHTDELMRKAFVTAGKSGSRQQTKKQQRQQQLKSKGNYSVDFQSKVQIVETNDEKISEVASAEGVMNKVNQDDSFTLVGEKENIHDDSADQDEVEQDDVLKSDDLIDNEVLSSAEKELDEPSQKLEDDADDQTKDANLISDEEADQFKDADNDSKNDDETNLQASNQSALTGAGHVRTGSNTLPSASTKKRKISKQEESALKKRKAKYDLILKQTKLRKEQEAAAAIEAKKERERQKQLQQIQDEEERKLQELLAQKRRVVEEEKAAKEREMEQERQKRMADQVSVEDDQDGCKNEESQNSDVSEPLVLDQVKKNAQVKAEPSVSQKKKPKYEKPSTTSKEQNQQRKPVHKFEQKLTSQKVLGNTPGSQNDNSFEAIQPQNFTTDAGLKDGKNTGIESNTPKNNQHRRGISWGISDRLTITQESEDNFGASDKDLDSTYNSQKSAELLQSSNNPRHTAHQHAQKGQKVGGNRTVHMVEKSPSRISEQAPPQTIKGAKAIAKENKRNQPLNQQKQYIAKQQQSFTANSKRNESQDYKNSSYASQSQSYRNSEHYDELDSQLQSRIPTQKQYRETQKIGKQQARRGQQTTNTNNEHASDEDYGSHTPGYFVTRGGRTIQVDHPYHQRQGKQQRVDPGYDSMEYESQMYGTKPRRGANTQDREYYGRGPPYGENLSRAQVAAMYQERNRPMFYQGERGQGPTYGKRGSEAMARRTKYQEQTSQSDYHHGSYYGANQTAFTRGEPHSGYGGAGRSRIQDRYFHDEDIYYREQDYDAEVAGYGSEVESIPTSQSRRGPLKNDYEAPFDKHSSKHAYYNQPSHTQQDRYYRKKQHPYADGGDLYDNDEDYHMQAEHDSSAAQSSTRRRFQTRKDYDVRQQSNQQLDARGSYDQTVGYGGNRRYVPPEERSYREKPSRLDSDQPTASSSKYPGRGQYVSGAPTRYGNNAGQGRPGKVTQQASTAQQQQSYYDKNWQEGSDEVYSETTPTQASQNNQKQYSSKKKLNYIERQQQKQMQANASQSETTVLSSRAEQALFQQDSSSQLSYAKKKQQVLQPAQITEPIGKHRHPQPVDDILVQDQVLNDSDAVLNPPQSIVLNQQPPKRPVPQKKYLDSDEDEDDLIESSAKHFLKTPGSRGSRRQSFDDMEEEDADSPYEAPKPSKNFFSTFKKIQGIFSLNKEVPHNGGNDDEQETRGDSGRIGGGSLFQGSGGSSKLNLFGGPQFDDYFREDRPQQSLFGGSSFFNQSTQQDLHSFNPTQQQEQEQPPQKQPSSLEALRMSSRPLQTQQVMDDTWGAQSSFYGGHQSETLFGSSIGNTNEEAQNQGDQFQWKKLEPFKPQKLKLPAFAANLGSNNDEKEDD